MRKLIGALALGAISVFPLAAHASYVSSVNLKGDFAVTGFNPAYDTDANPYTFDLSLIDVSGVANLQVPSSEEQVSWSMSGVATANVGGSIPLPPVVVFNQSIGEVDFGIETPGNYNFDFTNQEYTVTSDVSFLGASIFEGLFPQLNTTLLIDSSITALGADGVLNDVLVSFTEEPSNPLTSLSGLVNFADSLPTSGQSGTIDGQFLLSFLFEGEATSNVSEPVTLGLFGLGLAGFAARRRRQA